MTVNGAVLVHGILSGGFRRPTPQHRPSAAGIVYLVTESLEGAAAERIFVKSGRWDAQEVPG